MRQIFTSIDIGSDSIKVVVGELYKNKLNLLAAVKTPSIGIKKGLITDGNAAADSIKRALKEAEEMIGFKINKVLVNVPSYMAEFVVSKGEINIDHENKKVTLEDMENVRKKSIKNKTVSEKEYVTDLVIDYSVDDKTKISNPKGYVGDVLKVRTLVVTVPKKNIYSVVKVLELLGVEVVDVSIGSIGDMATFKTKEMSETLTAIINIGYETTSIGIYNKGIIIKQSILPTGGLNIDKDLSYIYKISMKDAEKLRKNFALAHKRNANVDHVYTIQNKFGEPVKINEVESSEIIMARIEDILTKARTEINNLLSKEMEYVLVTGGVSNMRDFDYIVSDIFGKNSRIGNVKMLGIRDNVYSSALGMIIHFINELKFNEKSYTMVEGAEDFSFIKKQNQNNDMLKKVFDYIWGE